MAGDKVLLTMDEGKERPHEPNRSVSPAISNRFISIGFWGGRRLAGPEKFIEIAWIQRWKDSEKVNCF